MLERPRGDCNGEYAVCTSSGSATAANVRPAFAKGTLFQTDVASFSFSLVPVLAELMKY